jgi:hypothetical protein
MGENSAILTSAQDEVIQTGVWIAERLVQNARNAQRYWSLWEAINARLAEGSELSVALNWHAPAGVNEVRQALAEAVILAVLRATDHPQSNDSLSACRLRGILANDEVVALLTSSGWSKQKGETLPEGLLEFERTEQVNRISWFGDHVPSGWGRGYAQPEKGDLAKLRPALREIRNSYLAHSVAGDFDRPTINQVRAAVELTVGIAKVASLIFLGHTSALETDSRQNISKYDEFWHFFERGLVSAFEDRNRTCDELRNDLEVNKAHK